MPDQDEASTAFKLWWTKGDSDSPAGHLALNSPAASNAWPTFCAGWEQARASAFIAVAKALPWASRNDILAAITAARPMIEAEATARERQRIREDERVWGPVASHIGQAYIVPVDLLNGDSSD